MPRLALHIFMIGIVGLLVACNAPASSLPTPTVTVPTVTQATAQPAPTTQPIPEGPVIVIDPAQARPFPRELLGTNVPAWLNPLRLTNETFLSQTANLGLTLLRMPGGSWSNSYAWAACELGEEECYWPWAAKPSDFLRFAQAVNAEIIWTVSINGSAQEAAALVAFFNGDVNDERLIGVDGRGRDWHTVGHWARLRAERVSVEPFPVRFWEIGNEVYGAKAGVGANCAEWGWEDVWTCDADEYLQGATINGVRYDGYLAFYDAMKAVDPAIRIGAVGVEKPAEWTEWGNRVIAGAGEKLDFYVVHYYPYFQPPESPAAALRQPQQGWSELMAGLHAAFDRYLGRQVPIAVTEYNLIAFQDMDNNQLMRRAFNMLFLADTIGQMATHGVALANQWDLANGRAANGTDYGLIDADSFESNPQYYALMLWSQFGNEMLNVQSSLDPATTLSVYTGRRADGTITLLTINKTAQPITVTLALPRQLQIVGNTVVAADDLMAETVTVTTTLPANNPSTTSQTNGHQTKVTFAPYAISLLTFDLP